MFRQYYRGDFQRHAVEILGWGACSTPAVSARFLVYGVFMIGHMTLRMTASLFAFSVITALALTGCGNHDQAKGGTMTRQQVEQNARQQSGPAGSQTTPDGQAPAATPATR